MSWGTGGVIYLVAGRNGWPLLEIKREFISTKAIRDKSKDHPFIRRIRTDARIHDNSMLRHTRKRLQIRGATFNSQGCGISIEIAVWNLFCSAMHH